MGVNDIYNKIGLTGSGVKVAVCEGDTIDSTSAGNYYLNMNQVHYPEGNVNPGDHSAYCAALIAGSYGIAPNAEIYSFRNSSRNLIEDMMDEGVHIFNFSFGSSRSGGNWYVSEEKYFDSLMDGKGAIIVKSSGNSDSNYITIPGCMYNGITVNAFGYHDGVEFIDGCSYLYGSGCVKPDIASYADNATSSAAAVTSGMIALLYEYKPALAVHPEVTKALFQASCQHKVQNVKSGNNYMTLNETMAQGLTARQGAGSPDMYNIISMVAQHSYGFGVLNSGNGYNRNVRIYQPKYNATNINVCMSYLQTGVTVNQPSTADNYDISLANSGFSSTKYSKNSNSSTEMIYANMPSNANYTLRVYKSSGSMSSVKYGYAWSTDATEFYPTNYEEGVYYIKNVNSGLYLTMNTNTYEATQTAFSSSANKRWILRDSIGIRYNLCSASGTDKNLVIGNTISDPYKKAIGSTSDSDRIYLEYKYTNGRTDGTFAIARYDASTGQTYRLGIDQNSTSSGAYAAWYPSTSANNCQKWTLESCQYKRGDVNGDGYFTSADITLAMTIYSNAGAGISYGNNLQHFLADYDGNGIVSLADVTAIQSLVS